METVRNGSGNPKETPDENFQRSKDLKHVFLLFRHGKRAPLPPLPPNVNGSLDDWPEGLANLTADGKIQMYEMGRHFRNVYSSYLTNDPREVLAMCRIVSRCFESAACFLAGMYPPKQKWIWNEELPWQPIQILTEQVPPTAVLDLTEEETKMLQGQTEICPLTTTRDILQELVDRYGSGTYNQNDVESILQYFVCRKTRGYSVPTWVESNWDVLTSALDHCHDFRCNVLRTFYARDSLSVIEKTLKQKFIKRMNGYAKKKITVYCFSDINMTGIFKILGSDITKLPPFGATMAIEVFGSDDNLQVQILYIPDIEKRPQLIQFSRCSNPCSLDEFIKAIELKDDTVRQCNL